MVYSKQYKKFWGEPLVQCPDFFRFRSQGPWKNIPVTPLTLSLRSRHLSNNKGYANEASA